MAERLGGWVNLSLMTGLEIKLLKDPKDQLEKVHAGLDWIITTLAKSSYCSRERNNTLFGQLQFTKPFFESFCNHKTPGRDLLAAHTFCIQLFFLPSFLPSSAGFAAF